jgi:hypothetical protein
MTAKISTIRLDVCTPEGNTWLARLIGLDPKYTFQREFVNASSSNLSGSGKTGSKIYTLVADGIYQSREGRRRLRYTDGRDSAGNRFYHVVGDEVTIITQAEAIAALRGGA